MTCPPLLFAHVFVAEAVLRSMKEAKVCTCMTTEGIQGNLQMVDPMYDGSSVP